ncbi:hypothetical protein FPOAC1_005735 [Fusarium poae]|jgi:hypothetical protein|uniref:F-box domain-containing protein n=1 Tax=Fusarium poae TaxID=36050 RepID=A0A1B8AW08_FUSPO|nr:hypothetical protein FPOAC1_005735 [Fusarium poae]KAG8672462.1 hypothetical protein FPOAC1_005735 [Fusarium poae]OBS24667.1 hypothetical protein FPOA_05207 [Fusarium poae]
MEPTSYSLQDVEEIIRVCTYHRYEFDDLLVRTPDSKLQAPFLQRTFNTPLSSNLGDLDCLPKEVMVMILVYLDIASYLRFRAVNNRARDLATDNREYNQVVTHGLAGFKTLLRVQAAQLFTIRTYYQALINPECSMCASFGTFMSLATCERFCFTCLEISVDLRVLAIPAPKSYCRAVNLSRRDIERVLEPKLRVVYGKYSLVSWPKVRKPRYLVHVNDVFRKLPLLGPDKSIHYWNMGCLPEHQSHMDVYHHHCYRYMASTAFPWFDPRRNKLESGLSCKGCNFRVERYVAANPHSGSPPWGFNDRDRIYAEKGFLQHFKLCEHAKEVWESARERQVIPESRFTLEGGTVVNQRSRRTQNW